MDKKIQKFLYEGTSVISKIWAIGLIVISTYFGGKGAWNRLFGNHFGSSFPGGVYVVNVFLISLSFLFVFLQIIYRCSNRTCFILAKAEVQQQLSNRFLTLSPAYSITACHLSFRKQVSVLTNITTRNPEINFPIT